MKDINTKPKNNEFLSRLMNVIDEDEDLKLMINEYWKEKIKNNEQDRFSEKSREAFNFLKKIFKYHEYDQRDGSIINKVGIDDKVIYEVDEVNQLLIQELENIRSHI